jgi:DNA processing protein
VSGLSLGVVVVEAGEKSGSLITADFALDEGKEVFAVPGKVDSLNSRGTNRLIKQGAKLTSAVEDITEELEGYLPSVKTACIKNNLSSVLDKNENLVYTLLSSDPMYIDDICRESGIAFNKLANILLGMEIKKLAKQLPGKNFVKI